MNPSVQPVSPFAMLVDPEAALAAIQRSERLSRLQGRICRPLDRVPGAPPSDAEAPVVLVPSWPADVRPDA